VTGRPAIRLGGVALLLTAFLLGAPAVAQQDAAPSNRIEQLKEALASEEGTSGIAPTAVSPELLGEEGTAALRRALTAYYEYRVTGYEHRQSVFAWQLLSSRIIFVLVIFLVLVGVYFSWLQFRLAMKGGAPFADRPQDTTFEASTTGLKVSSPVLGVIILALSLAFFYLYLLYVYPINDIL
jgi:hypothetical protein